MDTTLKVREALIYAESEDGLDLTGIMIEATEARSKPASTMILWIHGNTGNFYDYPYIMIGRSLAAQGYRFLSLNTRGHDLAAFSWNIKTEQRATIGSAWEKLEEAPQDIAGWIAAAQEQGAEQIILVGHSQGASKAVCYQATRNDSRVKGIVLASPDLHGHWTADFVAEARKLVESGRGDELMPPLMNTPVYRLSATNVVSRDEMLKAAYHVESSHLAKMRCPLLVLFGASGDIGGTQELESIKKRAAQTHVTTALIPNADHVYFGQHEAVAQLIAGWIETKVNRDTGA
ncbi:MAG TPA: alpha/beta fold hydrolase [Phototrophicaceae bacterium]|jgi:pimeloyl-ACP methyl ester carboxylesterase|nr:alpha/beta fold hydrolase [Phototrophicaceae bacterium]